MNDILRTREGYAASKKKKAKNEEKEKKNSEEGKDMHRFKP